MIGIALSFLTGGLGKLWAFIRTLNPLVIIIALLTLSLALTWHNASGWKSKAEACDAGRKADRANYTAAQAEAHAQATEAKRATEARYAVIEKEKTNEIAAARVANRDALSRWMREHAAPARHIGSTDLSPVTPPTGSPDAPVTEAVVPVTDLERCADAFTVAEGWQSWWQSVSSDSR